MVCHKDPWLRMPFLFCSNVSNEPYVPFHIYANCFSPFTSLQDPLVKYFKTVTPPVDVKHRKRSVVMPSC